MWKSSSKPDNIASMNVSNHVRMYVLTRLAHEWRNVASNREEWRKRINSGVLAKQEMDIAKAKVKRHDRHLAEEEFIWECPVCSFGIAVTLIWTH
ncbi:hypothetical protein M8J77_010028 [Diaphorina citri]|nr:hypothetical protein M8J77_010028 [Diaphorina citri]